MFVRSLASSCNENFLQRKRSSGSSAPSTTFRSLRELQWSPSPAIAGAERRSALATRSASEFYPWRGAKPETCFAIHSPLAFFFPPKRRGGRTPTDADPTAAPIGRGARSAERARLSAFHRGSHLRELFHPKGSASGQASWDAV